MISMNYVNNSTIANFATRIPIADGVPAEKCVYQEANKEVCVQIHQADVLVTNGFSKQNSVDLKKKDHWEYWEEDRNLWLGS